MPRFECEIRHEPEHFNPVCGCTIPEAFTAFVYDNETGKQLPKWPCGSNEEEARANVVREFGDNVQFS